MTSWQIGESGTSVTLNGEGKGEVTFTVTNGGTAQDRSVLTVTPLDGAAESWFTVDEPQRAVAAGASVVYPVAVSVPEGTAAGTYGLQGVAYSADSDPGESSVTSKRVGITVAPPPPPKKGIPPWVWIVVAAVVLLVVGVIIFLLTRDKGGGLENTTRPSIEGTPQVQETLTAKPGEFSEEDVETSFQWQRCDGTDCSDIDGAILQNYLVSNDDVSKTLQVKVTATKGDDSASATSDPTDPVAAVPPTQFAVPNVIGLTTSDAIGIISQHFTAQVLHAGPSTGCNPPVEDQVPLGGTQLVQGSIVTISTRPPPPLVFCLPDFPVFEDLPFLAVDEGTFTLSPEELGQNQQP
jgi:hypothetical protein